MTLTEKDKLVLNALRSFHTRYKKMPEINWLVAYTKLKKTDVNTSINSLIKEGILKNSLSQFKINNKIDSFINNTIMIVFRLVSAVIGIICIITSIKFTKMYLDDTFSNTTAILLSIAIVSFLVISYNVRGFLKNKGKKVLAFIFFILWLVSLSYSMISTLAVQAISFMEKEEILSVENSEENNDIILYQEYEKQIIELQKDIESARKEKDEYIKQRNALGEKRLEYIDDPVKLKQINRDYTRFDNAIGNEEYKIKKLKAEQDKIIKEKESLLKDKNVKITKKQKINFYEWLSTIFKNKVSPYLIQFILSTLPAIFIDIVGPLSIYIALFLRQEGIEKL